MFQLTPDQIAEAFGVDFVPEVSPRYNVAPGDAILIIRQAPEKTSRPEAAWVRWGLIPHWAQDPRIGARMINARAETVAQKPAFRASFRRRRCLVPMSGFYEWKPAGRRKQPYYVTSRSGLPLAAAGIWDVWHRGQEERIESCAIITVPANQQLAPIHDRMPALLDPEDWKPWLDPQAPREAVHALLQPFPDDRLHVVAVGTYVNDPRHEGPECIRPLENSLP